MEFHNATRLVAGYNGGLEPGGRELLVVVVKGTFVLPRRGEPVTLHEEQQLLTVCDTYTGEAGFSAPLHEVDFAARKLACDVLLLGSAYAPPGKEVTRTQVGLEVGSLQKYCTVYGDRVWQAGLTGISPSAAQPFTRLPVSYDSAFGGVDQESDDPAMHDAYMLNPVGRGYRKHLKKAWVDGRPLPNTEGPDERVASPDGHYRPAAFGPLGRSWAQRAPFAGTYDDAWLEHEMPFLPHDFDDRYYQAAPADQQIPFPRGPLPVKLLNLTADCWREFTLPWFDARVQIFPRRGEREEHAALLDTIVLEPDAERLTMTWRVTRPLRKSLFDIARVSVGHGRREPWTASAQGASGPKAGAVGSEA